MAFDKAKDKEPEKGKKPDWVVRSRQSPGSDFFITLGAGWNVQVSGKDAVSLKLNCLPVGWDGSALLMTPKDATE